MKNFFLRKDVREKSLMVFLVAAAAGAWAWSYSKRATVFVRDAKVLRADLAEQKGWIDRRDSIEANTKALLARSFEPAKTLSLNALRTQVEGAARSSGLTSGRGGRGGQGGYSIVDAPSSQTDQVTVNKVQVSVNGADWTTLQNFYVNVQKLKPYANIEAPFAVTSATTAGGRGGPATSTVTANFAVTSVEIKP